MCIISICILFLVPKDPSFPHQDSLILLPQTSDPNMRKHYPVKHLCIGMIYLSTTLVTF